MIGIPKNWPLKKDGNQKKSLRLGQTPCSLALSCGSPSFIMKLQGLAWPHVNKTVGARGPGCTRKDLNSFSSGFDRTDFLSLAPFSNQKIAVYSMQHEFQWTCRAADILSLAGAAFELNSEIRNNCRFQEPKF